MMEIRRATSDDAELLARLAAGVHEMHYEAQPTWFKPYALSPELIADFRERLADKNVTIFIGEVNGEAVGYILAEVVVRPENPYNYEIPYLLVDQMSVNPEHRSKGYGERLMQRVFEHGRSLSIRRVMLTVWAFNQGAISFYERQQFAPRAFIMEANLPE
jgi:GNAT superfamily N-acetyltransferase